MPALALEPAALWAMGVCLLALTRTDESPATLKLLQKHHPSCVGAARPNTRLVALPLL